jgi:phage terminase large subunit-like protein
VPDYAWDTLQFALRLGGWPQVVVTTTPRAIPLLKRIMQDDATAISRSRTRDNAHALAPAFTGAADLARLDVSRLVQRLTAALERDLQSSDRNDADALRSALSSTRQNRER